MISWKEADHVISKFIDSVGWPRIIIGLFLMSLFGAAPFVGVSVSSSLSNTLERFGMNGVLVLAMVPMIQSGCGLNFGLPLGIIAGLLGATLSIELSGYIAAAMKTAGVNPFIIVILSDGTNAEVYSNLASIFFFFSAICMAVPIAAILGYCYGQLLNRVKGDEMMIATYVGFSSVAFMCIAWLLLPFRNPTMIWGYGGSGLRTTITVSGFWHRILSGLWSIELDFLIPAGAFPFFSSRDWSERLVIPTGMLLFLCIMCYLVWLFMKTKTGTALAAVGSNPEFAHASGIDVDCTRTISVVLSTILGAIGILVYQQSFGFIQLYMGPFYMALPAVASILLGGASVNKATIWNVIIGTFLFQGILTMTPSVINSILQTDMSEVIRMIVSNGMILYALTRTVQVKR
jgi:simple sugar transport system permease protein